MKTLAFLLLVVPLQAAVPEKQSIDGYRLLWTQSPFTTVVREKGPAPVAALSDEWSLRGVSRFEEGYQVTIENLKKPGEIRILKPNDDSGFTVLKVEQGKSWQEMTVTLSDGQRTGVVGFSKDLITPKSDKSPSKVQPSTPPKAVIVPEP